MTKPVRLQLSRRKGFKLQALSRATNGLECVNVARPSKWGNRWTVAAYEAAGFKVVNRPTVVRLCVEAYRAWLEGRPHWGHGKPLPPVPDLSPLRGKNLACWCKLDSPCHGDILLELVNAEARGPGDDPEGYVIPIPEERPFG